MVHRGIKDSQLRLICDSDRCDFDGSGHFWTIDIFIVRFLLAYPFFKIGHAGTAVQKTVREINLTMRAIKTTFLQLLKKE